MKEFSGVYIHGTKQTPVNKIIYALTKATDSNFDKKHYT